MEICEQSIARIKTADSILYSLGDFWIFSGFGILFLKSGIADCRRFQKLGSSFNKT
jgi:hypothetical protein